MFIIFLVGAVVAHWADPTEKHRAPPNTIATERAIREAARSEPLMGSSHESTIAVNDDLVVLL